MSELKFVDPFAPKGGTKAKAPAGAGGPESHENGVPKGSSKEVLSWVDGDPEKALLALDAEESDDKPRKGLIKELNEVLGSDTEKSKTEKVGEPAPAAEAPAAEAPAADEPVAAIEDTEQA